MLPVNIGPAQRQVFGDRLREDVQVRGPLKIRPAAPLGAQHPVMQLQGSGVKGQRSEEQASEGARSVSWSQLPPLDGRTLRARSSTTSMSAPDASRMAVKLAASISVSRNATRQSSELPAKASMAKAVRSGMRKVA